MPKPHLERVLITGASGTLGYNVVRQLSQSHPETRLHLLMRVADENLFRDLRNVTQQQVDMLDTDGLCAAVKGFQPNAIIHCAASGVRPSSIGYFELVNLNVSATLHLFRAACDIPDCHFIQISTGLVYGQQDRPCRETDAVNTLHPYGATKAAADCVLTRGCGTSQPPTHHRASVLFHRPARWR